MTTSTATIAEFLLARIAEDEARAQEALESADYGVTRDWQWVRLYGSADFPKNPPSSSHYQGAPDPARVLATCKAHRAIVELHVGVDWGPVEWIGESVVMCRECRDESAPCPTLRALASIYADHESFRSEWSL